MSHCARLLFVLLLILASPARAAVEWTVLESDDSGVRVRVTVSGASLVLDDESVATISLPGTQRTGRPGEPALPGTARWVALPDGVVPQLTVLSSRFEELGTARLAPVPVSRAEPGRDDLPRLVERREFGPTYDSFRVGEQDVVVVAEPVHHRRQRMVPVSVRPVIYDAATGRARVASSIEFRISWPESRLGQGVVAPVDPVALRTVLNPVQAREWATYSPRQRQLLEAVRSAPPRRAPVVGIDSLDPLALVADPIRLRVEHDGIVRLAVADLIAAGGLPTDVPRNRLRLAQMRPSEPGTAGYPAPLVVDVPVHFFGQPDETLPLGTSDELYFHALRVEDDGDTLQFDAVRALPAMPWGESSPTDQIPPRYSGDQFNASNVYWVLLMDPPAGGWARMAPLNLDPSSGSPAASYLRMEHFEGNQGFRDEPFDRWVERIAWNRRDEVDVTRAVRLFNPVPGSDLVVRWGAGLHITGSRDPNTGAPVPITFSLRQGSIEQLLSSINLTTGGTMPQWTATVGAQPFASGPVEFHMRRIYQGSDIQVNSYLDHVELEYPAGFRAVNDALRFGTGSSGGTVDVEVEGYGQPDLLCFDVTDPRAPRWVDLGATNVEDRSAGGPSNFALSLRVPQGPGEERKFSAAPRVRFERVGRDAVESDPVADLFSVVSDAQVIAVGPEGFRSQMDRWIAWREQTYADAGWNFAYVDVQQIYDQFSGGLQSPWAIREFARYAWLNWNAVALLLVGDGSEDTFDAAGRAGASFVPPSMHLQKFSGVREIVASDKWYGLFGYTPQGINEYPAGLQVTSDLLVGRLPAANATELGTLIDKILAYEQNAPDAAWRRRTLWVCDDAYSTQLIGAGSGCYQEWAIEDDFRASQLRAAELTTGSLDSTVTGELLNADDFTRDCRQGIPCENLGSVRQCYLAEPVGRFIDRWSEGWLWLSYQGHAAYNVLGHENLFLAQNLSRLANNGRPWVFFGMGCHVADFMRFEEGIDGRSLGEVFLMHPTAGSIATYASSAFEFLSPNADFMEILAATMFERQVPDSPVFGSTLRNQWILGDVMARGEMETLALQATLNIYKADEMVAQYNVLGDPLLRMDAAPPRLEVSRGGTVIGDGAAIEADAGSATATLDLQLVDESGIDRLEISDSSGRDYSGVVGALDGPDPRIASLAVDLPVYPQAYSVEIAGFDAARSELRRTVLGLEVPLPLDFFVDGEPVAPGSAVALQEGIARAMRVDITSPVDLVEADIQLEYPGVDLARVTRTGAGRDWSVSFDAVLQTGAEPGALDLVLKGQRTELVTGSVEPGGAAPVVLRHAVFPNPVRNSGRIVVQVEGAVDRARLSVYDLAGNEVNSTELAPGASAPHSERGTSISFEFEARDRRGDELANGTYFYRIRVEGPTGSGRSDMGRLLIMR